MPEYKAPIKDTEFLLNEWLNIKHYKKLDGFKDVDEGFINAILTEGGKFCEEVLFPLNQSGDQEGCNFKSGKVSIPKGFKEAYSTYVQGGWGSFTCDPEYGGQGLPEVINMPIIEMMCSSNLSFGITPGLTHGAYNTICMYGSKDIKDLYLPKLASGKWSGVMCLTEPQCGTDLGLITTKAESNEKGSYNITGSKIFISSGEHDMTENIIHLVLARLPDAPKGSKGISMFVVPKIKVNGDGSLGEENNVTCGSIEHKMGINASPTCVMNYGGSEGFLIGEAHKGLRAMFTMMNEARLYVGMQGLGLAEVAYQNASMYAKERRQGRALKGARYPDKDADPIIVHPDIRRMLLTIKSFTEGARALSLHTALKIDLYKRSKDEQVKRDADDFIQISTPIIKAYFTDMGHECTNLAMQVFGGHGYIKEYGVEQYVRDARITQIYEGTNGIQALDLIGRKLPKHTGRYLRTIFHPAAEFIELHRDNENMAEYTKALYKAVDSGQKASLWLAANGLGDPEQAAAGSVEYLRLLGLIMLGHIWAQLIELSQRKLEEGAGDKIFYEAKIETGRFFMNKLLPYHYGLLASIVNGAKPIMGLKEEMF